MPCIPPCKPQYDFASLLEDDDGDCFYLPGSWQIRNPGPFFLSIHSALQARCNEEEPACTSPPSRCLE